MHIFPPQEQEAVLLIRHLGKTLLVKFYSSLVSINTSAELLIWHLGNTLLVKFYSGLISIKKQLLSRYLE